MGFDLHIPKQLQEEIRNAVPHLRLIIPAAAAVAWVFGKIVRPQRNKIEAGEEVGFMISSQQVMVSLQYKYLYLIVTGCKLHFAGGRG
jgi:hypothetical protein